MGPVGMKQSKMPADPNRRAKATADIVEAILNGEQPAKDPGRVERGKVTATKAGRSEHRCSPWSDGLRSPGRPPPLDGRGARHLEIAALLV